MQNDRNAIVRWINYKKTSYAGFDKAVKYVTNGKAAPEEYMYFQHLNPDTAVQDLQVVENRYGKPEGSRLYKHLVCSFGDPNLQAEAAYRFMKELLAPFAKVYPVLFAIHTNIPCRVHAHALMGMTDLFTGKKFSQGPQELLKFRQDYDALAKDFHMPLLRQRCPLQTRTASIDNDSKLGGNTMQNWNGNNESAFSDDEFEGQIISSAGYQPSFQGPTFFQPAPMVNVPMPGVYPAQGRYMQQGGQMPQTIYPRQGWGIPQGYIPQSTYPVQGWGGPQGYMTQVGYPLPGWGWCYSIPLDFMMLGSLITLNWVQFCNNFSQSAVAEEAHPVTGESAAPVKECPAVLHKTAEPAENLQNTSDESLPTIQGYRGVYDDRAYGVYNDSQGFNDAWKYWRHNSRRYQDFDNSDDAYHFAVQGMAALKGISAHDIPRNSWRRMNYRTIV